MRTSEPRRHLSAEDTVRGYKNLAQVERAFRYLKGIDFLVRSIRHRDEQRVKAHLFLCLLAYCVEWHMRKALALLFIAFGASAVGWNGIFLAEVARNSPHGMISVVTAGASVWNYAGILIGPAAFATSYRGTGSYTVTFGWLTVIAVLGLAFISAARRAAR